MRNPIVVCTTVLSNTDGNAAQHGLVLLCRRIVLDMCLAYGCLCPRACSFSYSVARLPTGWAGHPSGRLEHSFPLISGFSEAISAVMRAAGHLQQSMWSGKNKDDGSFLPATRALSCPSGILHASNAGWSRLEFLDSVLEDRHNGTASPRRASAAIERAVFRIVAVRHRSAWTGHKGGKGIVSSPFWASCIL